MTITTTPPRVEDIRPEEIINKIKNSDSMFGFEREVLMQYLSFEEAKPLLKEGTTKEEWGAHTPRTTEAVLQNMKDYMEFAWGKAEDKRGISASRSIEKMGAWLWLLGDTECIKEMEAAEYAWYGAPKLAVICRRYNFPIPQWFIDDPTSNADEEEEYDE